MLGVLLMQREEYAESYKLLNRLSENGDASASAWVGVLYADQKVTAPDRVLGQTVRSRMFNRVGPSASGVDREAESNFRAACLLFAKAYQANDILGGAMLSDCFLYGRDGRTRDAQRALEILKSLEARDDIRGHLLETAILYSYGEVLFAGQEFGMQRDLAKARSLWQRLLEVAPDGDENVPYAQAGLACIDQKKASKNCVALRCSIEGGTNCSAP
jgi:TPR repeat protein